jgi:hypothetical protein
VTENVVESDKTQTRQNANATNKSNYYIKKRGHDVHYNNNHHHSSGNESPNERNTPIPSNGEVDDNKLSNDEKLNSNYHIYYTPKKRRLVKKKGCGSQVPNSKKEKNTCGAWFGNQKETNLSQEASHLKKKDNNLLNIYDDITRDDEKSCLSITDENGLSFVNSDEDDALGFLNWQSMPVGLGKSTENRTYLGNVLYKKHTWW